MTTFTTEQFIAKIDQKEKAMRKLTDKQLPVVIGKVAVDYFKGSFDKQAWGRKKWKEVQRRKPGTSAYNYNAKHHPSRLSRGILIGDNVNLKRSIQYDPQPSKVDIVSDLPYFSVHNEGLMAGRKGHQFKMPRRQSVGKNNEVNQIIKDEIINEMHQTIK